MTIARANWRALCGSTAASAAPSRRCRCQSSGRAMRSARRHRRIVAVRRGDGRAPLSAAGSSRGSPWPAASARRGCRRSRRLVQSSTILPASMKMTRWLTLRAKPISWVTTIIVMPSLASSTITSSTSPTISGSSAEVGSSNSMTIGSISARGRSPRAAAGRRRAGRGTCPCAPSGRRGRASSGRAPWRRPAMRLSTLICASVRFSVTVRCGNSSKCWNTMPTRERSLGRLVFGSVIEMPSTTMSPFWNGSSALTVLISVDLPEPDGPQTTTTSPFLMRSCSRSAPGSCRTTWRRS